MCVIYKSKYSVIAAHLAFQAAYTLHITPHVNMEIWALVKYTMKNPQLAISGIVYSPWCYGRRKKMLAGIM